MALFASLRNATKWAAFALGRPDNAAAQAVVLVDPSTGGAYAASGGSSSQLPSTLGPQAPSTSLGVAMPSDVTVTGPAALSAANADLLTGVVNGWFDATNYRSGVIQIIAGAGISAGAVIFEGTNDTTLASAGNPIPTDEIGVATGTAKGNVAALTISASTIRSFKISTDFRYIRVRISTAFVGGTVQAVGVFSQIAAYPAVVSVTNGTAANLATQSTLTTSSVLIGDVGIQPRATTGGFASVARLLTAAATTNATSAKASAGRVYKVRGYCAAASLRYLKLYNKSSAPSVGVDTPFATIPLAPSSVFEFDLGGIGHYCSLGVAYAITGAVADADTTALTAGDVVGLNIWYS